MKYIRFTVIGLLVAFVLFFALVKPEGYEIAGNWTLNKVVFDGEEVFVAKPKLVWGNQYEKQTTLQVYTSNKILKFGLRNSEVIARYEMQNSDNGKKTVLLSSSEKALNGIFSLEIDSVMLQPRNLHIEVRLQSGNTLLHFEKNEYVKEFEPELPRKGQV